MSESKEIKRAFDYFEGDFVQITSGSHAGEVGRIDGIVLNPRGDGLMYQIFVNDEEYAVVVGSAMKLLRHADD